MLCCSGGTAEQQRYEVTAGDNHASPETPDAVAEQPDRVQKYHERLASVSAGDQAGRYGLFAHRKAFSASHIEELDYSEKERLFARFEARIGAAMAKVAWVCSTPALCRNGIYASSDPGRNLTRAYC